MNIFKKSEINNELDNNKAFRTLMLANIFCIRTEHLKLLANEGST